MAKHHKVVVTRTPLRISFVGGGTDFPDYYRSGFGAVLSTAIDKYVYVTVKEHGPLFAENYRLNYSETEQVASIHQIRNNIVRECLRFLSITDRLYISTISDLPGMSGLGSSSSFAVGLLNALYSYRGETVSAGRLAAEASSIEIDVLKQPIGKQDQYAAAYGGINYFTFGNDGNVSIEPQRLPPDQLDLLFKHCMLFWTGVSRSAQEVLIEQKQNTNKIFPQLNAMRDFARLLRAKIQHGFNPIEFAQIITESWDLKRQFAAKISNEIINAYVEKAFKAGAYGGKLLGAGAGGFLLFIVPPERQQVVRSELTGIAEVSIAYEAQGSKVLINL